MPIESLHPQYLSSLERWTRCRDVCDGLDSVKRKGKSYLPMLPGDDATAYGAYKDRALFFNATGRTKSAFVGMAFHKPPAVKLTAEQFVADPAMDGRNLVTFSRAVLDEVLEVGRCGTLVDWSEDEERPYFVAYQSESIRNWRTTRVGGRMVLVSVVLGEAVVSGSTPTPADPAATAVTGDPFEPKLELQLRELALENGAYVVRLWRKSPVAGGGASAPMTSAATDRWQQVGATIQPKRGGQALPFIPFVFHSPTGPSPEVVRPPMLDIVDVNLSHYRSSADLEHGRFYVSLPTPWITGVEPSGKLTMGSGKAWEISAAEAKVGMLEFTGQGLAALEKALADKERMMAVLGSRMLEAPKREVETAEAMQIRAMADGTSLTQIVQSASEGLTEAAAMAFYWQQPVGTELEAARQQVMVQINTDFLTKKMSADELRAVVASWQAGGMSKESLVFNLQRGDYLDPKRSVSEELAALEAEQPPLYDFKRQKQVGMI